MFVYVYIPGSPQPACRQYPPRVLSGSICSRKGKGGGSPAPYGARKALGACPAVLCMLRCRVSWGVVAIWVGCHSCHDLQDECHCTCKPVQYHGCHTGVYIGACDCVAVMAVVMSEMVSGIGRWFFAHASPIVVKRLALIHRACTITMAMLVVHVRTLVS